MPGKVEENIKALEEAKSMPRSHSPLKPDDFPLRVDGDKVLKQSGKPITKAEDPAIAKDVADRLNSDEEDREQDKWSA